MSRRASMTPGAKKASEGTRVRRSGSKDNKQTSGDPNQVKEGDVVYKTVRIYPSLPDLEEEVTITSTKPLESLPPGATASPPAAQHTRRSATADKRGSTFLGIREDGITPDEREQHGRER